MANVKKTTKGKVANLTRHFERHKQENGEYIKFKNQEIDVSKSHLNYNLAVHQKLPQLEFIKKRTSEVYCLNREDVNIMCNWVVTKPKDVRAEEQELFFKETYKFLENRYGKDNVISSYVHLDETTPHLHFAFVPVIYDKKKDKNKVSAKEVVNRVDLKTFHNDLNNYLAISLGRRVSVLNDATKDGNKSIEQLKRESIEKMQKEVNKLNLNLESLRIEYKTKKAYVDEYDRLSDISMMFPDYAEIKEKGLIKKQEYVTVPKEKWEQKHIGANEKDYLKKANDTLDKSIEKLKSNVNYKNLKRLEKEVRTLERENLDLSQENKLLKKEVEVVGMEKEVAINELMDRINEIISELPEEQAKQFVSTWNEKKEKQYYQSHNKGFDMER